MTAVSGPEFREVLAKPEVRRRLVAMISRRVPADATEDVVQAVLCDALVARDVPALETVPRWLFAIARHKIADFHRRARRLGETLEAIDDVATCDPIEERDLLEHAHAIAPDARAFEWIVRAEEGATLAEIAEEEDLPAPVVRQRVSRLRRALRTALLAAAAVTVALLVAASHERVPRIGADPVARPNRDLSLDGSWHVVGVECAPGAPPACETARGTRVRIEGNTAVIGTLELDVADTLREYHARIETTTNATIRIESDLGAVTLSRD